MLLNESDSPPADNQKCRNLENNHDAVTSRTQIAWELRFVRRFALAQSVALVPLLAAALLAGLTAKALVAWLWRARFSGKSVARWWFGAVGAIQTQAPAKLGILLFQCSDLASQFSDQCIKISRIIHALE